MTERLISSDSGSEDDVLDITLRPKRLNDFVGQDNIKESLNIFMQAAKKRKEPIEHVLLYGPPGLGKTTLAHVISEEMGANIKVTSGPAIERAGDLAAILTNLSEGDILFIDEIHRLNKVIEEVLYPAMEDYALDIVVGKGTAARTLRLDLPKFTIIGATTRYNLLSAPLRDRFGSTWRLDFYNTDDMQKIIDRSARMLTVNIDEAATSEIALRARSTPRIANRLVKRVRDFADVKGDGKITHEIAKGGLGLLNIDGLGLDEFDRRLLQIVIDNFNGGPVGLTSLAAALSDDVGTIEDIYEPFLLQLGLLERTPRGRIATEKAYKHLDIIPPTKNETLWGNKK